MLDTNVVSTPNVLKLNGYPIILLLQSEMVVGVFLSTTFNINCFFRLSSITFAIASNFLFPLFRIAFSACPRDIFCRQKVVAQ